MNCKYHNVIIILLQRGRCWDCWDDDLEPGGVVNSKEEKNEKYTFMHSYYMTREGGCTCNLKYSSPGLHVSFPPQFT